jgi:uncharacterized protein with PQ loop repeat
MRDNLLTWTIFVIAMVSTLPQLYQSLTTDETRDLNTSMIVLSVITNSLLIVHGYNTADRGILLLGAWFTAYWGILLGLKLRK